MPKQSKTKSSPRTTSNTKTKPKTQPEISGITTKKWYWIMLTGIMVVVISVAGYMMKLNLSQIAVLLFTIALLMGLMGYVKITPSNLSTPKRLTFLFIGASVIGFSVWAAVMLAAINAGVIESLFVDSFFAVFSFIIALIAGAFIGELLGKNRRIQTFFFKPELAV